MFDSQGRELAVGDPVTLTGDVHRRRYGRRSHGTVSNFGSVLVHVRISDSSVESMIGQVVPVQPGDLQYGHHGDAQVSTLGGAMAQMQAEIEALVQTTIGNQVGELIRTARDRSVVTSEQAAQLLGIWRETHPLP